MEKDLILSEFAEEASFLWLLRDAAVKRPDYTLAEITELDGRIEANLDGLRVFGPDGWDLCLGALKHGEPGNFFVAAVLAFEGQDGNRVQQVIDAALQSRRTFRGLLSAIGWISDVSADRWIPVLLESSNVRERAVGFAGLSIRRNNIGPHISAALQHDKLLLHGRLIRAAGELKQRIVLSNIRNFVRSESEPHRFWSAWAATLLGDRTALEVLKAITGFQSKFADQALQLVVRVLQAESAEQWLRGLAKGNNTRRHAIVGCGASGDPAYVSRLIGIMSDPTHARVAGEAFSMITGVDLAYEDMDADWPEGFEAGPTEDPADENVELDEDEDLPWPNQALVQEWWNKNKGHFQEGQRYLCGRLITEENSRRVLREGYQRQRIAAAYELALMNSDEPLFNWKAPGFQQQEWLGLQP